MARPETKKSTVEPGLRKIERVYSDGRKTTNWEIRLAPSPGRKVSSGGTYATKDAAKRALIDQRKQVQDGSYASPTRGKVTLGAVAAEWLEDLAANKRRPRKVRTIASHRLILNSAHLAGLMAMSVGSITTRDVEKALDVMDRCLGTQLRFLSVLSSIFTHARRRKLIAGNPLRRRRDGHACATGV